MKIRRLSISMSLVLALSACVAGAPNINVSDSQAVTRAISIERDDFKKIINFQGPNASGTSDINLLIRAWKADATGKITYQIYVMDKYHSSGWRFYSTADDSNGNNLDTTVISRKVVGCYSTGCTYNEHLALNIEQEYLEKNQETGIRFKLSGKAGDKVFFIPSGYIKAFLSVAK